MAAAMTPAPAPAAPSLPVPATDRRRLVFVLADGLRADTARECLGYARALEEAGRARWQVLSCELPSLSRPLYATVINGRRPVDHGIVSNAQAGLRCEETIFDALAAQGGCSAVAAYHWFYELLAGEVFDPLRHREAACPARGVVAGRWYFEDPYPDSHLLADAEHLRLAHRPDLLFVHPMGPDLAGHLHGAPTPAYSLAARRLDMGLACVIPGWHAAGYDVLLTSDHGMNADRMHGGADPVEREVPFIWMPAPGRAADPDGDTPAWPADQLGIKRFVLDRLGLAA